ncbi:MAG: hypothetical protein ACTS8R_01965 [Arsenophonus sp. NC-QC1-MAG3]
MVTVLPHGCKIRHNRYYKSIVTGCFIEAVNSEVGEKIIIFGLKQQYDERLLLLISRLQVSDSKVKKK